MVFDNYIGWDLHKGSSYFVVEGSKGEIRRREKVKTTEGEILAFIRSVEGTKGLALEETSLSQWAYMLTVGEVDRVVVCNAAQRGRKLGPKTDFRDALELAELLRIGGLREVFHLVDPRMELRVLVNGYVDLVQEIVRTKNRYKALFGREAKSGTGSGFYRDGGKIDLLGSEEKRFSAKLLLEQINLLEEQKESYLKRFTCNLKKFKEMRSLACIPGIGPVFANQLVGIIVTPERFPDKYNFFSYASLVKHAQWSDGKLYGKTRAYGRTQLKYIFKTAAQVVLRGKSAFRRKYDEMLANGYSEKAAKNAVIRHLASTVLGVWKSGKRYNDKLWEVQRIKNCHDAETMSPRACQTV